MTTAALSYGLLACLSIALLVAAATDLRRRQIDNWLNAAIALAAPLFWWASALPWAGMALQVGIALVVFLLLCGLFALGVMGGGDVKLLTALALWLPWRPFLELIVLMALIGGVLTVASFAWHTARRRRDPVQVPYGVAIAAAGLFVLGGQLAGGPGQLW